MQHNKGRPPTSLEQKAPVLGCGAPASPQRPGVSASPPGSVIAGSEAVGKCAKGRVESQNRRLREKAQLTAKSLAGAGPKEAFIPRRQRGRRSH